MNHGSLFSGIGGFDLAAQWMGWNNIFHCEKDSFCRKVLTYHWPQSISHADITETDFTVYRGRLDILTGGFPCQPFSTAGKQKGTEDDRHLWPEMLRAVREIRPRYVVGENVRGLVNWNGGMVFDQVQTDLENEGYEVLAFLLPASGVDAPHQRYRIWFVAYANGGLQPGGLAAGKSQGPTERSEGSQQREIRQRLRSESGTRCANASNASIKDDGRRIRETSTGQEPEFGKRTVTNNDSYTSRSGRIQNDQITEPKFSTQDIPNWRHFPTQSPLCDGDDGLPSELDGITVSRHRRETIKAGGNAIVPQLALKIFQSLATTSGHWP
ncbi:MAG: DNA (cytosine-5-)-methyltransferase [Bacteroidota bacterium]